MRAIFCTAILLLSFVAAGAQGMKRSGGNNAFDVAPEERLYFGGGGGFGFGTSAANGYRYSYFSINPLVGINITDSWSAGPIGYYQSVRYPQVGLSLNQYGGGAFTKYKVKQLFAWAEYDMIDAPRLDQAGRKIYSRFPLGIGFQPAGGGRAGINLMALYDVIYNRATSPFSSPWILRVVVVFGAI